MVCRFLPPRRMGLRPGPTREAIRGTSRRDGKGYSRARRLRPSSAMDMEVHGMEYYMRKTCRTAKRSLSSLGGRLCGPSEKACPVRGAMITDDHGATTANTGAGTAAVATVNVGIPACTLLNSQQLMSSWEPGCSLAGQHSLPSPIERMVRPLEPQVINESFGATVASNSNSANGHRVAFRFRMDDIFHICRQDNQLGSEPAP